MYDKNMISRNDVKVPLDVPEESRIEYVANYLHVTQNTGRLMLFAGDQKVEHLNSDFFGEGISPEDNDPEHLFKIASKARIGAFATQFGMIARYGRDYPQIPYIVKLNSKTNLVSVKQADPISNQWYDIDQVIELKRNSKLSIVGVGYTLYLGSEYESQMLQEAAMIIAKAHAHGLLTIIWCYPRGKAVTNEKSPEIIAGAAGVAACLGSDFVKVNAPKSDTMTSAQALKLATQTAGRTGVVCAGGSSEDAKKFLEGLHDQIHIGGTIGNATGRNVHQRPLQEAIKFCNAIAAITLDNASVDDALAIYSH